MRVTLSELGLTEEDFNFELVDVAPPTFPNLFHPFQTERLLTVKVNGFTFGLKTNLNLELVHDLQALTSIDTDALIKRYMKEEAITWFINNKQYQRKLKLQKINDVQKRGYSYL